MIQNRKTEKIPNKKIFYKEMLNLATKNRRLLFKRIIYWTKYFKKTKTSNILFTKTNLKLTLHKFYSKKCKNLKVCELYLQKICFKAKIIIHKLLSIV